VHAGTLLVGSCVFAALPPAPGEWQQQEAALACALAAAFAVLQLVAETVDSARARDAVVAAGGHRHGDPHVVTFDLSYVIHATAVCLYCAWLAHAAADRGEGPTLPQLRMLAHFKDWRLLLLLVSPAMPSAL
jgi:hypothetical protein